MAHMITQIRDAAVAALAGMLTVPASRVFVNRTYTLDASEVPCVLVMTGDENSEYVTMGVPRGVRRDLRLDIDVCVEQNSTFDDTANQIQLEVEKALAADITLNGLAVDLQYTGRGRTVNSDGETKVVVMPLSFTVIYRVNENTPDVAG